MIEHIWTVICSRSIINKETNNITLFEVLEQLNLMEPPLPLPEGTIGGIPIIFEVVTLWNRSNDEPTMGRARLQLLTPSGSVINEHEYSIDLTDHSRARAKTQVVGLPVQEFGRHQFRMQLWDEDNNQWRDVTSVPLYIFHRDSILPSTS